MNGTEVEGRCQRDLRYKSVIPQLCYNDYRRPVVVRGSLGVEGSP